jgi:copper chaperone NosL
MRAPRRRFLSDLGGLALAGFTLTPLAAALAGCSRADLPEGLVEIKWDRDTCVRCNMIISDRRFAAQAWGGPKKQTYKFDDIGCAVIWLKAQGWGGDAAVRIWVADSGGSDAVNWLDARQAHYTGGKSSPMGYNFAAVRTPLPGSLDFTDMRQHILAKGK